MLAGMIVMPFEPRRFSTAAAHYLAGRIPYEPRLIQRVVELTGLTPASRVLDLGCGPGQLAKAFAPFVHEAMGVDPEPEMLRAARTDAPANVQFVEGSSYDLSPQWGRFQLVAMGRSFHWMDRVETLRRFETSIEPGGALALFHDSHPELPENAWWPEAQAIIRRYTPEGEHHSRRGPGWVPHKTLLLNSRFSQLEEIAVIERRTMTVDGLAERALSFSSVSHARIGELADTMVAELRQLMQTKAPDGVFTEVVATEALLATRAG
jgi:SAM-dependent methyltransferase